MGRLMRDAAWYERARHAWEADDRRSILQIAFMLETTEDTLRALARKYGWAPRRSYRPKGREIGAHRPTSVTLRCQECGAIYSGVIEPGGSAPPHLSCRAIDHSEARTPHSPEASP